MHALFLLVLTVSASSAVPAIPQTIRVGLQSCVGHPASLTIKADEPMTVTDLDTKTVIAEIEAGKEITIRLREKLFEVETTSEAPEVSDVSDVSEPAQEPPTFKGPLKIATQTAEGMLEITDPKLRYKHYRETLEIRGGSRLTVINELSVEHYLYGVTPTEIPASFHPEAQKALVVAARTYAIRSVDRHKSEGFNVCDGVHCQGFAGADREADWVRKIVDATRGEIITYKGEPIFACYSADCGGMTQSSEDSGMMKTAYMKSVVDNACGEPCLVRPVIGDQSSVIGEQSDGSDGSDQSEACPRPAMTEFERPTDGDYCASSRAHTWTKTYSVEDLAKVFSRSSSTKVGKLISMEFAEYDGSGRVRTIIIKGQDGEKRISGSRFRDLFGLSTIMSTRMALTVTPEGKYVIEGRGYGHGVGLCQWGANGLAKSRDGITYVDVLKHYYTGVEITRP